MLHIYLLLFKKTVILLSKLQSLMICIPRALELFVASLLNKASNITMQKNARTLTIFHL